MFDINKIIKKSKNNSMFNNFNFNTPISNPINNFKGVGASPKMQKMWGNMSPQKRNVLRKILPDNDGDRVPNIYDCQPNNVMRQDKVLFPKYLEQKGLSFNKTIPKKRRQTIVKQFRKYPEFINNLDPNYGVEIASGKTIDEQEGFATISAPKELDFKGRNLRMTISNEVLKNKYDPNFIDFIEVEHPIESESDEFVDIFTRDNSVRYPKARINLARTIGHELTHAKQFKETKRKNWDTFVYKDYRNHSFEYERDADVQAKRILDRRKNYSDIEQEIDEAEAMEKLNSFNENNKKDNRWGNLKEEDPNKDWRNFLKPQAEKRKVKDESYSKQSKLIKPDKPIISRKWNGNFNVNDTFDYKQENEIYSIDWDKDQKGKQIGEGHWGKVYEVKDNPNYVLKVPKQSEDTYFGSSRQEYNNFNEYEDKKIVAPTAMTKQGLVREKLKVITRGTSKEEWDDNKTDKQENIHGYTYVENNDLTDEQANEIVEGVNELSENNILVGDELQIGIAKNNKPYIYDIGEFSEAKPIAAENYARDDNDEYKRRFLDSVDKSHLYDRDHEQEEKDAIKEFEDLDKDDETEEEPLQIEEEEENV